MNWQTCKNILCIRADNMGDVIMSTPAFRALKETFGCRLTLLTSKMGSLITPFIKEIDETIVSDLPWVKTNKAINSNNCFELIEKLKAHHFDAAVIFTVYSQNPLPSALIAYMANIPLRLAYCRENPYDLLTDWLPDKEPYTLIRHQVRRDLCLVQHIGAKTSDERLSLCFNKHAFINAAKKLSAIGFDPGNRFIIAHPGVSDKKREYPCEYWSESLKLIKRQTGIPILLTGSKNEKDIAQRIKQEAGENIYVDGGLLTIEEFICMISHCEVIITVNTSSLHIAAALHKPVVALYAQTNPQHTPWLTKNAVLTYSISQELKSKNEVIGFVDRSYYGEHINYPLPVEVAENVLLLLGETAMHSHSFIHHDLYNY
jgi:lipopolysaccharide heptosyltransferase II